jgi:hypothetical protein
VVWPRCYEGGWQGGFACRLRASVQGAALFTARRLFPFTTEFTGAGLPAAVQAGIDTAATTMSQAHGL